MRRLVWPGVAWLLVAVTGPLAAQRVGSLPPPRLETLRPAPSFPMALVPFHIPAEWCRGGGRPRVSVLVYDILIQPVGVLRIRGRDGVLLDRAPLRCGNHVAYWNGGLGDPPRLVPAILHWLRVHVEREGFTTQSSTPKPVFPQY